MTPQELRDQLDKLIASHTLDAQLLRGRFKEPMTERDRFVTHETSVVSLELVRDLVDQLLIRELVIRETLEYLIQSHSNSARDMTDQDPNATMSRRDQFLGHEVARHVYARVLQLLE